ncbi:aminotransferase class V-fold PLP-dependent enzyme [Cryobacterium sp. 1639]|uniref:pyridoxal phosphate-dependent decarboxylase family protein n=1 Tax=Cryobacterium inferilacus TaxID=2866629 RepID=UPI001C737456|nr:aminotransferase class V-fold PLP-dependent enzyme [Cryobacterium sp. 1639]MBX0299700.1 aminotransferase class V-fold PLP-dependent enzyme [Cryobacterium sp. 1639]
MTYRPEDYREPLEQAARAAREWLDSLPSRPVKPREPIDTLSAAMHLPLTEQPTDAAEVVAELARLADPGLMPIGSGRFFGWVMGGTLPAALAADWLVSAWDQNNGLRYATPAAAAIEERAGAWILDLLHLPAASAVGFTTGGTMANFVGLAAGRGAVLRSVGWDVNRDGLTGAPRLTVLAGAEVHSSVLLALRYLGLGEPTMVAADPQGRIRPDALSAALASVDGPCLVVLQAGNLHSGAFDPMRESVRLAHDAGAWVHVDGAFGLWAAASSRWATALDGLDTADSWATDAHKTLNVPYDCGIAVVADPAAVRSAFAAHTSYFVRDDAGAAEPMDLVPELSRRARGIPVWAALRSLGQSGTVALVEGLADNAGALAEGLAALPGVEVLNDVVFTQVSVSFGSDDRTVRVTQALLEDGAVWMSGSHWRGRAVLRISVSNWSTDDTDVAVAVDAVARALAAVTAADRGDPRE